MSYPRTISRRIPATTQSFEVLWARQAFMKMSPKFREIRANHSYKGNRCWWCRKDFEDGDMMALVCIKTKGNKLLCQKCGAEIGGEDG